MGTVIAQNRDKNPPNGLPSREGPVRKQASLLDVLAARVVTWTLLAEALELDSRKSEWLRRHGIPHRRAGNVIFISREALVRWIEAESTSSPDPAESSR